MELVVLVVEFFFLLKITTDELTDSLIEIVEVEGSHLPGGFRGVFSLTTTEELVEEGLLLVDDLVLLTKVVPEFLDHFLNLSIQLSKTHLIEHLEHVRLLLFLNLFKVPES